MRPIAPSLVIALALISPIDAQTISKCRQVNVPCIEQSNLAVGQPLTVVWSAGYFRTTPITIRMFQGNVRNEPQSDFCQAFNQRSESTIPILEWTVNTPQINGTAAFTALEIDGMKVSRSSELQQPSDTVFFQIRSADGNCQLSLMDSPTLLVPKPASVAPLPTDNSNGTSGSTLPVPMGAIFISLFAFVGLAILCLLAFFLYKRSKRRSMFLFKLL
jgi:hypothetical protein